MAKSEDYLKRIIYHFLNFSRARRDETLRFKALKHNDDLCPGLRERIELILDYFHRYKKIAYDIQGMRDEGTDVILRYYVNEKAHFICFQIKSYTDLKDSDYLRKLKAQYVDSQKRFEFEDYYIILATDEAEREERRKIRSIEADLNSIDNLTIIEPSKFLFFWQLKSAQIGAIIKSYIDQGDLLIQSALMTVTGLFKPQYCLIFSILDLSIKKGFSTVEYDDIFSSQHLRNIYEAFPVEDAEHEDEDEDLVRSDHYGGKDVDQMIIADLEFLSEKYFEIDENKNIVVDLNYLKPIVCLILEAQIKYDFDTQETIEYLEQLLFAV